jgi:glycosyltransferase involved in cell wall biosynthesis
MSTEDLGISIIVPTEGRASLVWKLLSSLRQARENYNGVSELWIIDSSGGEEQRLIQAACEEHGANYQIGPKNVREKRNKGIEMARYPILLFTDSDCEADPQLLVEHARLYIKDGTSQLGGVVGLTQFSGDRNWLWEIIDRTGFVDAFTNAKRHDYVQWGTTSNISYKKVIVESIGRFETAFPFRLGGDDVDLGLRVTDSGHKLQCNPNAIVYHTRETWDSTLTFARRIWRWGRMHFYIFRRYPKRQIIILPRLITVLLLLLLAALVRSVTTGSYLLLLAPALWFFLTIGLSVLIYTRWVQKGLSETFYSFLAALFFQIFEFGVVFEGLIHANFQVLYMEISSSPPNKDVFLKKNAEIWAMFLMLMATFMVLF